MTKIKKYKTETPGYYFTYSDRQHPMFKDQTEKWALLFEEGDQQLISELNTEADKVNGMDKFTHKEVIGWFDSILNPPSKILSGVQMIDQERRRQISDEKITEAHDATHENGELAKAAAAYTLRPSFVPVNYDGDIPKMWPFENASWKPSPDNRIKELAKAGALIAAEIDRLQAANK